MIFLHLTTQRRTTLSNHAVGLVALCGLAACHTNGPSAKDASPTVPGSDASPTAPGSDASSTAPGGDAASAIPAGSFASAFASAYCDGIADCCRRSGYDSSSCQATLQPQVAALVTLRTADPSVVFDEAAAANCINVYRASLAACTDQKLKQQLNTAFRPVFRGTVPVGGLCSHDYQCIVEGTRTPQCAGGVCVAGWPSAFDAPHGAVGAPCIATCELAGSCSYSTTVSATATVTATAACWTDDGVYCSSDGICAAAPAIGETCAFSAYCGKDAHCENGLCALDQATGPCQSSDECLAPSYCDHSGDASSGQCFPLKANGATCSTGSECAGGQCFSFVCRTWTVATPEACAGLLN